MMPRLLKLLAIAGVCCAVSVTSARAQESAVTEALSADEERLVQRIKEELLKELGDSELFQQQIERGIEAYVRRQREAQAEAQAAQQQRAQVQAKNVRRVSAARDHVLGNPDATVTLIEYSDFECPFCKRFHVTAKKLLEAYDGRVNWVYRHFPLNFHNPGAQKQAEASECAAELGGNDAFWRYTDTIYERTTSNGRGFPIDALVPLAEEQGLDAAAFRECLDSERFAARVREDLTEGSRIGISGTPGNVLLNNRTGEVRLVSGAVPLATLRAAVDQLLAP